MTREHENAIRTATDFQLRGTDDRLDLLNQLVMEGTASLVASGPSGWLELNMYGVNASGSGPWELIGNWCAMVARLEAVKGDNFTTVRPPIQTAGQSK